MASKTFKATVNKAGDTMTGNLTVPRIYANDRLEVNPGGTFSIVPSTTTYITKTSWNFYSGQKRSMFAHFKPGGGADCYRLPENSTESGNKYYDILTSKDPVEINQGGTGATTAAGALTNLGLTISTTTIPYDDTTNWTSANIELQKWGKIVQLSFSNWFNLINPISATQYSFLKRGETNITIPSNFRPNKNVMGICYMNTGVPEDRNVSVRITNTGTICFYASKNSDILANVNMCMSAIWITD